MHINSQRNVSEDQIAFDIQKLLQKNSNQMNEINFKDFLRSIDNNLYNPKVLNINDFKFS